MALRRKKRSYLRPVNRATASRTIYNEASGILPTVALKFEMTDGEVVEFELTVQETAKLIEQATSAYHAIVPVLRTGRSPFIG